MAGQSRQLSEAGDEPTSRRGLIAGVAGVTAGVAAGALMLPGAASAAAGQPVVQGAGNNAGTSQTSLTSATTGSTLAVVNSAAGTSGRALTCNGGTGTGAAISSAGTNAIIATASNSNAYGAIVNASTTTTGNGGAMLLQSNSSRNTALKVVGSGATTANLALPFSIGVDVAADYPVNLTGTRADFYTFTTVGGKGVYSRSNTVAITADGDGQFNGDVDITGTLTNQLATMTIDDPADPANKTLNHGLVASPDAKTVYDGVVTTDADGNATVSLPAYFGLLNGDFRYQLTAIGAPAPNLHVAAEIADNRFTIAGAPANGKVSWQVTGIRKDPYARDHPIVVEKPKPTAGTYRWPSGYGRPASSSTTATERRLHTQHSGQKLG
ncbi:hypothetical protein [Fodinicola acaciae]|uniref:hypothetical protein n=1 Tax=Fodinicola acaciae TaxID=2681555 RepID=UPI0013D4F29B|nr:hypothetical protein [Fodinicola acaciae]